MCEISISRNNGLISRAKEILGINVLLSTGNAECEICKQHIKTKLYSLRARRGAAIARLKAVGSSKGHSHPAKKYIRRVFMFGHLRGNRIPNVLIAWNEPDRRSEVA